MTKKPVVMVAGPDDPPTPGYVTFEPVFGMMKLNAFKTALQVYRTPSEYYVHLTDGATGQMVGGLLSRFELTVLRDKLNKELAS